MDGHEVVFVREKGHLDRLRATVASLHGLEDDEQKADVEVDLRALMTLGGVVHGERGEAELLSKQAEVGRGGRRYIDPEEFVRMAQAVAEFLDRKIAAKLIITGVQLDRDDAAVARLTGPGS